jgi:hypothetical protein
MDALSYAPGTRLHRVRMTGAIVHDCDRVVAEERTIIWSIDATSILLACARHWALEVAHLWDAPPKALEYLKTGNDKLRRDARSAARAAISAARKSKDDAMIVAQAAAHAALNATATPNQVEHEAYKIAFAAAENAVVAIGEKAVSSLPDSVRLSEKEQNATYVAAHDAARERQEKHIVKEVMKAHKGAKNDR